MSNVETLKAYLKQIISSVYTAELAKTSSRGRQRYALGSIRNNQSISTLLRSWETYASYLRATGIPVDNDTFFDVLRASEFRFADVRNRLCNDVLRHFIPSATIIQGMNPGIIIDDPELVYRDNSNIYSGMVLSLPVAIYDVLIVLLCINWTTETEGYHNIFRQDLVQLARDGEINYDEECAKGIEWALEVQSTLSIINKDLLRMFYEIYDDESNDNGINSLLLNFTVQLGNRWRDVEATQGYVAVNNSSREPAFLEDFANGIRVLLHATQRMLEMIGMPLSVYISQKLGLNAAEMFSSAVSDSSELDISNVDVVPVPFKVHNKIINVDVINDEYFLDRLGNGCKPSTNVAGESTENVVCDNTSNESEIVVEQVGPVFTESNDGTFTFVNGTVVRHFRRADRGFAERVSIDAGGITMDIWRPLDGIYSEDELRGLLFAGTPRRGGGINDNERWRLADTVRGDVERVVGERGEDIRVTRNRNPDILDDGDFVVDIAETFGPAMERAIDRVEAEAASEAPQVDYDDIILPDIDIEDEDDDRPNEATAQFIHEAIERARQEIDEMANNDDTANAIIEGILNNSVLDDEEVQARRFTADDINVILANVHNANTIRWTEPDPVATVGTEPDPAVTVGTEQGTPVFRFINGAFRLVRE